MKFSIPALALLASITPALADYAPGEVYIKSELRSDRYVPKLHQCENTLAPEIKVTEIEVYTFGPKGVACEFFKDADCQGDKWTIKAPVGSPGKQQKFSKPFYAASLSCSDDK
ncbi:unnamed protein product [Penicillium olsonii]|nr:unnamed protein product [Penicillium olsonii]CAG7927665.1 unnamed protein product [Penicillium olsonii]